MSHREKIKKKINKASYMTIVFNVLEFLDLIRISVFFTNSHGFIKHMMFDIKSVPGPVEGQFLLAAARWRRFFRINLDLYHYFVRNKLLCIFSRQSSSQ